MTRSKSHEPVRLREKEFVSADEITQAIEKLRARIKQVEELKKEGLAYRDALRTTAEFQIRDTVREIFGDKSPEYHEHQHHKVKANTKSEVNATITMLQDLITSLEHKLRPPDPASEAIAPSPPPAAPPDVAPPIEAQAARVQTAPPTPTRNPPAQASPSTHGHHHNRKGSHSESSQSSSTASAQHAPAPTASGHKESSAGRTEKGEALPLIRKVCSRFHPVVRQLRQRSEDRPAFEVEDETDVRDLLRALLSMEFEDITVEEWLPTYANGAARSVILLRPEGIVIDVKKTRQGLGTKELAEQAMVDFEHFPGLDCRTVFCFVYDPEGRIPNPRRLESDLTGQLHGRTTEVVVSPK